MKFSRLFPTFSRRWLTWRIARRSLLALALAATLIALGYGVENWRGHRAWARVQRDAAARGLPLTSALLRTPEIPDAENTFAAPIFREMASAPNDGEAATLRFPNRVDRWLLRVGKLGSRYLGNQDDLASWRELLGSDDLVAAFAPHAADLAAVEQACERPRAELPMAEFMPGLDLGEVFGMTQFLGLRARVYLDAGQTEPAARDVRTLLRLARKLNESSRATLLVVMVSEALANTAREIVASGLRARAWDEPTLVALDAELGRIEALAAFRKALENEFSLTAVLLTQAPARRDLLLRGQAGVLISPSALPSGWFLQNAANLYRLRVEAQAAAVDPAGRRIDMARWNEGHRKMEEAGRGPYTFLVRMAEKNLPTLVASYVDALEKIDLTRLACRLERHRLATGGYPKTLGELAEPPGREGLHNLLSGEAYGYALMPDGRTYRLETKAAGGAIMTLD